METKPTDTETVRVLITAEQTVTYRQYVTMARDQWEHLKVTPESSMEDRDGPLTSWLDLSHVYSGENFDDFDMVLVDEDGNPTKPIERYETD